MLEYAKELMKAGEYVKALSILNEALLAPRSAEELLDIYIQMTACSVQIAQFEAGVTYGELGLEIANELAEWNAYGEASRLLGYAYHRLGRPTKAIAFYNNFCQNVERYEAGVRGAEPNVWYNMGLAYRDLGARDKVAEMLERAIEAARRLETPRMENGLRHALIHTYLSDGNLSKVPALMAKCLCYMHRLAKDPAREANKYSQYVFAHFQLRVIFAIKTKRLSRALLVATEGLRQTSGVHYAQAALSLNLAHVFQDMNYLNEALQAARTALTYARRARSFHDESEAMSMVTALENGVPWPVHGHST